MRSTFLPLGGCVSAVVQPNFRSLLVAIDLQVIQL
jgi:hypothetical protein